MKRDEPGYISKFGELSGIDSIQPKKILEITPYVVTRFERFKKAPENPFQSTGKINEFDAGLDAKIGLTNFLTMDLTVNPDFGQVEADPSRVNLSAFETFFEEKRPFFVEGKNITSFGLGIGDGDVGNDNLFYSRRIGRQPHGYPDLEDGTYANVPTSTTILGAAKLTGKSKNGLSLGFVEAVTAGEYAEIDNEGERTTEKVEPLTNYLVGRVQKDYNEGKTILGGIFTSTNRELDADLDDIMHKSAYTGGIDFTQYFKDKSWMVNINAAFSQVNGTKEVIQNTQKSSARYFQRPDKDYALYDPDRTSLAGSGGRMQIMKLNGHLNLMSAVIWKTPGFETNDLGYIREADQVLTLLWAGYNVWEPKWIYRRFNLNADVYFVNNFGGDIIGKGFEWNGSTTLKNYWNFWTGGNINTSSLDGTILRGGPMMRMPGRMSGRFGFSSDSRKKLGFEFYSNFNKGFENYYRNSYTGLDISYKPTNYLSVSLGPGFTRSFTELQYVTRLTYNNSTRYIFASIDRKTLSASLRINLNLSPDLTFQYWGQPFVASGRYHDYKYILDPVAENFNNRFHTYEGDEITAGIDNFTIDENRDGTNDYSFDKKDFNVQEFLSNFVVRWEYQPGSTVYIVWSQSRSGYNNSGRLDYFNDIGDLFDSEDNKPHNVFLIKFSYRFGLK